MPREREVGGHGMERGLVAATLGSLALSGMCREHRARLCCQTDPKMKGFMNLEVRGCGQELFF